MKRIFVILISLFFIQTNFFAQEPNTSGVIEEAYKAIKEKNYSKAYTLYNEAIKINASYAPSYYGRGLTQFYQGQYLQALNDFDKSIALDAKNPDALLARGVCYIELNNITSAISDLEKSAELKPKMAEIYYAWGNALYIKSEYEQAIVQYAKAIENNPKYANAYYGRAACFRLLKNNMSALSDFQKYISLSNDDDEMYTEATRMINLINEGR